MTSNLGMHAARDLERELMRAYDGEVPIPFYWQLPSAPPRWCFRKAESGQRKAPLTHRFRVNTSSISYQTPTRSSIPFEWSFNPNPGDTLNLGPCGILKSTVGAM